MVINNIRGVIIEHEKFGIILNEMFVDLTQFTLFLKAVNGCITLGNDLTFFNGTDFLIHVPHKHLVDSIVRTQYSEYTTTDYAKSKIESIVSK